MTNEALLFLNLAIVYIGVLFAYLLWGKVGLFCFTVFSTVMSNIEVLMLVDAFSMEQTLGNVLFASTFIITDILSENEGKKEAHKAVLMSISASLMMVIISQMWLLYTPSEHDWAFAHIRSLFHMAPRLLMSSLIVFIVVQNFDVWIYHKIWELTEKKFPKKKFLWLRNNVSTMISQLINSVLYTLLAFWGLYSKETLMSIILSSYAIFIATSILDTPIVYIARKLRENDLVG